MDDDSRLVPGDRPEQVTDQMTLTAQVHDHLLRVVVVGEVDVATATALSAFIQDAITPAVTEQVIDLSGVTFLDSSGVRAVVLASRDAAAAGRVFSLWCPVLNTAVSRVLEILHVSSVMTVVTGSVQRG